MTVTNNGFSIHTVLIPRMADDIAGCATLTDDSLSSGEGASMPYDNNRMGRIRSESRDCHGAGILA